jgi:hypothetical protein
MRMSMSTTRCAQGRARCGSGSMTEASAGNATACVARGFQGSRRRERVGESFKQGGHWVRREALSRPERDPGCLALGDLAWTAEAEDGAATFWIADKGSHMGDLSP